MGSALSYNWDRNILTSVHFMIRASDARSAEILTFIGPSLARLPSWPASRLKPTRKSPIVSPDLDSKPAISRSSISTLIPRRIHGDRKTRDKPKTTPSRKNKPENIPGQEKDLENKFV